MQHVFQAYSASQFTPATYQVGDSHVWPVPSLLGGTLLQHLAVHLHFFRIALKGGGYIYFTIITPSIQHIAET